MIAKPIVQEHMSAKYTLQTRKKMWKNLESRVNGRLIKGRLSEYSRGVVSGNSVPQRAKKGPLPYRAGVI